MSSEKKFQKSIFDFLTDVFTGLTEDTWQLWVDGASRGNPGKSGAGIYIVHSGKDLVKKGFLLGECTNNEAEYLALFIGVYFLKMHKKDNEAVKIISDSQLLIRQMQGIYKIKKPELKILHTAITQELAEMTCIFEHREREYNTIADMLANKGIDEKTTLPLKLLDLLRKHEIFL